MPDYSSIDAMLVDITNMAVPELNGVWHMSAPWGTSPPYCTFVTDISVNPSQRGDAKTITWSTQAQLDWWGSVNSDDSQPVQLRDTIDSFRATINGKRIRANVENVAQIAEEPDANLIHYVLTINFK